MFKVMRAETVHALVRNLNASSTRQLVKFLIKLGGDFRSTHPVTGFSAGVYIVQCGDEGLVDVFLSSLEDINKPLDSVGGTALHHAVRCSNKRTVLKLLQLGANPNRKNLAGNSPVHEAVLSKGHELLNILVSYGGDINGVGAGGRRPLHMVAFSRFKEASLDSVLACKPDLEATDADGNTPLVYFMENFEEKLPEILKLLEAGCDVNARDKQGFNMLHLMARKSRKFPKERKLLASILIQHGIDIDARDNRGDDSPLHTAVLNNSEMVDFLLLQKANLFALNAEEQTPFDTAVSRVRISGCLSILSWAILKGISEEILLNSPTVLSVVHTSPLLFIIEETVNTSKEELSLLKKTKLKYFQSLSLYDLLNLEERDSVELLRKVKFRESLSAPNVPFGEFRLFKDVLKEKVKAISKCKEAKSFVIEILFSGSGDVLPLLCIEKIVYYLDTSVVMRLYRRFVTHTEW